MEVDNISPLHLFITIDIHKKELETEVRLKLMSKGIFLLLSGNFQL